MTALAGGFDKSMDLLEQVQSLQKRITALHTAAENLQKERDNWCSMWQKDGLGHANAQEMMAQEIDALIQLLTQAVDALEKKEVDVTSWRLRLRGYANSSGFLDAVFRNRENFLRAAEKVAPKS